MSPFASDRPPRRAAAAAALLAAALLTSCELDRVAIPATAPGVVVHSVLNVTAPTQIVLLERTLTGTVDISDSSFTPIDPIASAGGIPITGATVEIIDERGRVFTGTEDEINTGESERGTGVYQVPLAGSQLQRGTRYELRIHTLEGEEVTAFTRIPRALSWSSGGLTQTLNRDHDALRAHWDAVEGARSYAVRIESPFGPFFLFTDSTGITFTGELRNLFANNLERVFIPGFRQDVLVAAVDSNFYDYYRTNNDPFTGTGLISRVQGGLGLFGSLVELNTGTITVTADRTEPAEGQFRLVAGSDNSAPTRLTLYLESPGARADLPSALSGRYTVGLNGTFGDGLLGHVLGQDVTLAFLRNQSAGDTISMFTGRLSGDTLRGTYVEGIFARPNQAPDQVIFVRLR